MIEEWSTGDAQVAHYVHGPRMDELLVKVSTTNAVYYHHDALGNTTHLTGTNGAVVEKYSYDTFGTVTIKDGGGNTLSATAYANRFLFTGREWLAELSLYDYRNRIYSPELGRFLQTDPIQFNAGDVNIVRYVGNNSINTLDALGLGGHNTVTTGPHGQQYPWSPYAPGGAYNIAPPQIPQMTWVQAYQAWNVTTLLGVALGQLGMAWGNNNGQPVVCIITNGVVYYYNNPVIAWGNGLTLGMCVNYSQLIPSRGTVKHEAQHITQFLTLGPLYLPLHLQYGLLSLWLTGTQHRANPLEWGPHNPFLPTPWQWYPNP